MAIYTQLLPTATPGRRYSFLPKIPITGHEGLFTELSVIALPGGRHVFLPKTAVAPTGPSSAARQKYRIAYEDIELEMVVRDDKDFLELLIIMVEAGIFD